MFRERNELLCVRSCFSVLEHDDLMFCFRYIARLYEQKHITLHCIKQSRFPSSVRFDLFNYVTDFNAVFMNS